jgi:hypothetical protein
MDKIDTSHQAYLRALADFILSMPEVKHCVRDMIIKVYMRDIQEGGFEMVNPNLVHLRLKEFPDYNEWKQNLMNIHTLHKVGKIIGHAGMFKN